jgi:hypothetical protein
VEHPVACSRASEAFLISSPLLSRRYERLQPDFADYASRGRAAVTAPGDQVAWRTSVNIARPGRNGASSLLLWAWLAAVR